MNALFIAALTGSPVAAAAFIGLARWSARLTVVEWDGPADHPRHAPRVSPADAARLRAVLASRARAAGGAR